MGIVAILFICFSRSQESSVGGGGRGERLLLNCCMISALVGHHNVILAFGGVLQTSMSEEGPTIRGLS